MIINDSLLIIFLVYLYMVYEVIIIKILDIHLYFTIDI